MSISEWSTTAADNASAATGINWAEGQAPSTVNDSARQMMADIKSAFYPAGASKSAAYTTVAGDHLNTIEASGTITISLGDASTMGAGYRPIIANVGSGTVTVALATSTDTLNGTTNGTLSLGAGQSAMCVVNTAADGYIVAAVGDSSANFPSGTKMVFMQTSAPTGWTKDTSSDDDQAIRFTTGTASSGGANAFTTTFNRTATETHALTIAEMPVHKHDNTATQETHTHDVLNAILGSGGSDGLVGESGSAREITATTSIAQPSITMTNADAGSGDPHGHAIDIRTKYIDVIAATKD